MRQWVIALLLVAHTSEDGHYQPFSELANDVDYLAAACLTKVLPKTRPRAGLLHFVGNIWPLRR
jgi:hypothetical protein